MRMRCLETDGSCPGVCVVDRIAEYCDAYFITGGLCKSGSKCCVSRDIYTDKMPADLHIPNTNSQMNKTASKPTKQAVSTTHARPKPTKQITTHTTRPQQPFRESVDSSNGGAISRRPCDGECVGGIVSLFCEDLDSEAYCPNEGNCCLTGEDKGTTAKPKPVRERSPKPERSSPHPVRVYRLRRRSVRASVC